MRRFESLELAAQHVRFAAHGASREADGRNVRLPPAERRLRRQDEGKKKGSAVSGGEGSHVSDILRKIAPA
jgi:hypothetical protein